MKTVLTIMKKEFARIFKDKRLVLSLILPGVLIVETCAQLCSLTVESEGDDESLLYVLLKIDGFKFLKPVLPGDVMTVSVTKKSTGGPLISFDAVVTVDGQTRAKGNLAFTAMPRAAIEGNGENA